MESLEDYLEESLEGSLGGMERSFPCVLAGTLLLYNHKETPSGICKHPYEPARGI